MILSRETLHEFALSDAALVSVRWEEEGRDIALDLRLGDGRERTLRCSWISALEFRLIWPDGESGMPLSWGCECELRGKRWWLELQFPPHGAVRLQCAEARLD